ncbi:hypothetical protein D3C80_406030 [compost metagenome]
MIIAPCGVAPNCTFAEIAPKDKSRPEMISVGAVSVIPRTAVVVFNVPEVPTPIEPTLTSTAPTFAATFKNAPLLPDAPTLSILRSNKLAV